MGWDYNIRADGVALSDYCDRVVVVTEGMANREDTDFKVPGLEGQVTFPNKLWDSGNVVLVTFISYTNEYGQVTHPDGAAGHAYQNFSALKRLLGKNGLVDLRRDTPDYGDTSMMVELISGPSESSFPAHQVWVLKAPKPFWKGLTPVVVTSTQAAHIPAGDAVVDDMVVVFAGDGKVDVGGEWIEIVGHSGGSLTVDCGARTITQSTSSRDRWFHCWSDRWLKLYGGRSNAITFTGSVTSLTYYPSWHGTGG